MTATLVMTVALVALLVGVDGLDGGPPAGSSPFAGLPAVAVSPAEAATLNRLAQRARAANGNTAPLRPGQYQYVKYLSSHGSNGAYRGLYRLRSVVQEWWAWNGGSRVLTRFLPVLPLRASDRRILRAHRADLNHRMVPRKVTNDFYPPAEGRQHERIYGRGLPATPEALFDAAQSWVRAQLHGVRFASERRRANADYMFNLLGTVLAGSLSPKQRAAAYTDLKYLPGVHVIGARRDATGRAGIAIQLVQSGTGGLTQTTQLIVAPRDGALLQDATWQNQSCCGGIPGSAKTLQIYLKSAIVGSATDLPGGGDAPVQPGTIVR